uniref:Tissue factor pathway inhibitor a n=1 Tax=Scleropages formosus TaxID=113540 RepID=A0A8C9RJB7_SCLFO
MGSIVLLLLLLRLSPLLGDLGFHGDGEQPELRVFHHSCALKMDEGPCRSVMDRFYFNADTRQCERFDYGGCEGNANNFETFEECEETCVPEPGKNSCRLEEEAGPCRSLLRRYFFNSRSKKCETFFYGGCLGNANNFKTLEACQVACHTSRERKKAEMRHDGRRSEPVEPSAAPVSSDGDVHLGAVEINPSRAEPPKENRTDSFLPAVCFQPIDRGTCDGSSKRYLYNRKLKRCQIFLYSGCGGNKNNFVSRKQCMKMCLPNALTSDGFARVGLRRIRIKKKNSHVLTLLSGRKPSNRTTAYNTKKTN